MAEKPEWQTGDRRGPQELSNDRSADARQPNESREAFQAWLAYLEHGTIRAAAEALEMNRRTIERYSKRWRWPERQRLVLAQHVRRWQRLADYEEQHGLDPIEDGAYLADRELDAMSEIEGPTINEALRQALRFYKDK
jgi:hypothetical protein